jgi:dTDP-4-dehydrorhamnose 3,5-epimerase-like enzyme
MNTFEFFKLPEFNDDKGTLVPLELKNYIGWQPKRVYYAINNKNGRGGHAHRKECELFICLKGEMTVKLHDGSNWRTERLKSPLDAVRVDNMIWHEFTDFSGDAILLAVSSTNYDSNDYVRDLDQFLKETKK